MTEKLTVMEKDGVSYVRLSQYNAFYPSQYRINGVEPEVAPGDRNYAMVTGTITSIEAKRTPTRKVVGFALADRYKEITQLPHEMPADAFFRDDGEWCGVNAEFYVAKYDDPQPYYEPLEFEIIDKNCEPVAMPSYVTVEFPHNIARHKETQHKYPCRIDSGTIFGLLYDRVKAKVAEMGDQYYTDDFRNIQTLTVTERIAVPFNQTATRSYYPTARSRKPKTETYTVQWKNVKVFEICGPEYRIGGEGKQRTPVIRGDNYADLCAKLDAYIDGFLTLLEPGKREVCRHCRGEGVTEVNAI